MDWTALKRLKTQKLRNLKTLFLETNTILYRYYCIGFRNSLYSSTNQFSRERVGFNFNFRYFVIIIGIYLRVFQRNIQFMAS